MPRDTDVRWMPINSVAMVASGATPSRSRRDYWNGGDVPWVRTSEINFNEIDSTGERVTRSAVVDANLKVFPAETVLLAMYGEGVTRGRSAILNVPAAVNQATAAIVCNRQEINPRYLYYYLESAYQDIRKVGQGSNQTNLNSRIVGSIKVAVPALRVQRRIVEALDALGDNGRSIEVAIGKLRAVRQGVRFSLMSVGMAGGSSVDSSCIPLKDVVFSAEYGLSESLVDDPSGVPVLRMNNLQDGRVEVSDLRYCPVSVPERLYLKTGDVLFNRTNSVDHIGKSALWRGELPAATFASYLVRLHPKKDRLLPEYLVEWLMHPVIRQRVRAISTVAVQQVNVNPSRLRELEIDLPNDLAEQWRIVSTLAAFDARIIRELDELVKLRKLKQGLTDDLLSGKVSMRDVD